MTESTLTSKGQTTVPQSIRAALGDWSAELHVPEGASQNHQTDQHEIVLTSGDTLNLVRRHEASPKTAQAELYRLIPRSFDVANGGEVPRGIH